MHTMHFPQMRRNWFPILVQAEKTIQTLEAKKQQEELKNQMDAAAAASVSSAITAIKEVTLDKRGVVAAARAAYDTLSDVQKSLVTNYSDLQAAESRIAALVKEGDLLKIGTAYHFVLPAGAKNENEISLNDAYAKMADELGKASSIGADKAATVKNNGDGTFEITQGTVNVKKSLSFSLHVGADADATNKINVNIEAMSAAGLGIKGLSVKDDSGVAATYATVSYTHLTLPTT